MKRRLLLTGIISSLLPVAVTGKPVSEPPAKPAAIDLADGSYGMIAVGNDEFRFLRIPEGSLGGDRRKVYKQNAADYYELALFDINQGEVTRFSMVPKPIAQAHWSMGNSYSTVAKLYLIGTKKLFTGR